MRLTIAVLSSVAILPAAAAHAQSQPSSGQPAAQVPADGGQQVAQQCRDDLQAFGKRVDQEGYWLTGWRSGGAVGTVTATSAPPATVPTTPADGSAAQPGAAPAAGVPSVGAPAAVGPWGNVGWQQAPAYELSTLYDAAYILSARGDQKGCEAVLAELTELYGEYATQLREAGVDPNAVSGWRAQEVLAARPVTEIDRTLRLDDIAGTDLRTPNDEYLGSIEDVVLDPQSGGVAYAIVERDTFLGIGGETVAVPWSALKATPGLNMFVLDVDEAAMEQAPTVDAAAVGDPTQFQARREEIDRYWQGHLQK
jgi:sporulation protein YlmC with PRC-barrel domain